MTAVLVRHFLAQFASFEAVSPSGHARRAVIAVVSLLAAPGYLMAVVTVRGARRAVLLAGGAVQPELWLWRQEWTLFVVSLCAVTVLATVQWRALVLGWSDYRILGVLPVARRTVTLAKVASVASVVLMLHGAVNALPGIILPIASPLGYLRPLVALQLALLLQTVFACAFVVAVQGLCSLLLPKRAAAAGSSLVQFALLLCAAFVFLWSAPLSRLAYALRDGAAPINAVLPVVWFRALYLWLAGVTTPAIACPALRAVVATAAATAVALACCVAGYRDDGPAPGTRRRRQWRWLTRIALKSQRRPVAAAVSLFVRRALAGSPTVALVARGWLAVGLALSLGGAGALALRQMGRDAPLLPTAPLHAPAIVVPFFVLAGLRVAAVLPASVGANWIFRLTETPRSVDYAAGSRSAAMRLVWPVLAVLGAGYAVLWGPGRALAHVVLSLALASVSGAWLFFGFPKVPFTCTYQPGKANLRVSWPGYAAIFLLYCAVLPALAERALSSAPSYTAALLVLLAARAALVRLDERALAREGRLSFEDREPAAVTALELES